EEPRDIDPGPAEGMSPLLLRLDYADMFRSTALPRETLGLNENIFLGSLPEIGYATRYLAYPGCFINSRDDCAGMTQ
ncbi:MAG: hypothetical protein L0H37_11510, partial [Nitrosospira sp.]|nr:hypothetical protein [Nitrosospira sp.]